MSGLSEFRSFGDGESKGVLDLLETIYLSSGDCSIESYNSQVRNVLWRLQ